MKSTAYATLIFLSLITLLDNSCKKDTAAKPPNKTSDVVKYLTLAPWKYTKWELKTASGSWVEYPLSDFQKTIEVTYKSDHTLVGSSASNLGGTETVGGTWQLTDNETVLVVTVNPNPNPQSYPIAVLNATTLQFAATVQTVTYDDASGNPVTYYAQRLTQSHP